MKDIWQKLEAVDLIGITIILACTFLIALGHNSVITMILVSITSFYFGNKMRR